MVLNVRQKQTGAPRCGNFYTAGHAIFLTYTGVHAVATEICMAVLNRWLA